MFAKVLFTAGILQLCIATHAEQVQLTTGDLLYGQVIEETTTAIIIEHPILGKLEIPAEQVLSISETIEGATESWMGDLVWDATTDMEYDDSDFFWTDFSYMDSGGWDSRLELGFTGTRGNMELLDLRLAFDTYRSTSVDRLRIDASYHLGSFSGTSNRNEFSLGVLNDWLIPDSSWFYFAQGRYDYDQFDSWEHRMAGSAGLGYHLIEKSYFDLMLRTAMGAVKEFYSENEDVRPEGLLGSEFVWRITTNQRLTGATTFHPDLDDMGEYRIRSNADWTLRLSHADGINLKFGLQNEYQSKVREGFENNDLKSYGTIVIDF